MANANKQKLLNILTKAERLVPYAYDDKTGKVLDVGDEIKGNITIGVGRAINRKHGLSLQEITYLLNNDVNYILKELHERIPWFHQLSDVRRYSLVEMAFQMGVNGVMGFSKTLRYLNEGEYSKAAKEALDSKWAREFPERAKRVTDQLRTGEW